MPESIDGRISTPIGVDLRVDVHDVPLRRADTEREFRRNLAIAPSGRQQAQHADFARSAHWGERVQPCGNRVGAEQCESCAERLAESARCRNVLLRVARPAPLLVQLSVGEQDQCALIGGASAVLPMPTSPEIRTSRPQPKKSASRERCLLALTRHEQRRVVPVVEVRRSVHTWSRPRSPHWW